ncbi:MAG: ABC transporter permease [Nitrospirae bacterium CG18_big_fil_WC_8_21_14_2_50_70_55]|nr:ABC transporter permease [Deltaproteobacteria bacterium]OIP67209.1 MAG: hypothetical protein AUK30_01085 [Nitrospirae bacterium CG2_30_70_394]PIQ04884.1 MAG: ABC transporter permease [Nitrospirae bacterium CG18_big_fil_WC_8_21_14_2_50_70_55]PIU78098.1 MAG: ABC transporter permease [Nitrospirae bacterium CG06_land_8_20_14_3_00_70_43]PIW82165.1 MAG: ABC transporter permease [Nitrospirae bacterium CG_4_8_14_3_um_filter_70_85]PIX82663.1 MAG: ABC transporter permease [Nitrospirae bacterium CG_4_
MAPIAPSPRRDRLWLATYGASVLLCTSRHEIALFALAIAIALLLAGRHAGRLLRRAACLLVAMNGATSLAYALVARIAPPFDATVLVRLNLRTLALTLLTLAVVRRVNLAAALAPLPTLAFLLTLTLGQIGALRRAATELRLAWTSRTPVRPCAATARAQAAAATEALLRRGQARARSTGEAMRSRGLFDG